MAPAIGLAIAGVAAAVGSIESGHEQAGAATSAAQTTVAGAEQAAVAQADANAQALAQTEALAESNYQTSEANRFGNYQSAGTQQQDYNQVRSILGLPALSVPSFVPAPDPGFTSGPKGYVDPKTGQIVTLQPGQQAPAGATVINLPNTSGGTTPGMPPTQSIPGVTSGATTPSIGQATSGTSSGAYQPLLSALNGGSNPQSVIAQFNASQKLQPGASYAWRAIPGAPGGGVVEVPGGAYLAPGPDGQWGYTAAPAGAGASTTAQTFTSPLQSPFNPNAPGAAALPQSIGSYLSAYGA